jgi:hypothetical protein
LKNQIRVQDLITYAKEKSERCDKRYKELLKENAELVQKAKNHWFYRLFPFLFSEQNHCISHWDLRWACKEISNQYASLMKQAIYAQKCNMTHMYWPDCYDLHEPSFYDWCDRNNIPY